MPAWRLIVHAPADAAWNMAVDETLLDRYAEDSDPGLPPTVRLYSWSPSAVSLGRKQPVPASPSPASLRERGIDLVRRPTGGRAVFHDDEWTYAVAGRIGSPPLGAGVLEIYRAIAGALVEVLARLGVRVSSRQGGSDPGPLDPRACFEVASAHEIVMGAHKVVGSAQARRRRGFLQHGSIPFAGHGGRPETTPSGGSDAGSSPLRLAAGGRPDRARMEAALRAGFLHRLGVDLVPGALTDAEALRAAALRCWKYDSAAWTLAGRLGERERRWGPTFPGRGE